MFKKILELKPQTVFIIQGTSEQFDALIEDASKEISQIDQQKKSRFTVEDAKKIVEFNLEMPEGSWCIIYFDIFMKDATQILLKTLEEPREGIHIIFITPHPYLLPQTLRSRARIILDNISNTKPSYLSSKEVLLEYVKETFGDEKKEASLKRAEATELLDAIEHDVRDNPWKVKVVYESKDMLFRANMPTKQVVEFLVSMVY